MAHLERDEERLSRLRSALEEQGLDAVVCALPGNVLMVSGYWPVLGTSLVVATRDGTVACLAPEDEIPFAEHGWPDRIEPLPATTLEEIREVRDGAPGALGSLMKDLGLERARVGYEAAAWTQPAPYSAMFCYGGAMRDLLQDALPDATLEPADALLNRMSVVKTPLEVGCLRRSCTLIGQACADGVASIRPGVTEAQAASAFQHRFIAAVETDEVAQRWSGMAYCMAGPVAGQGFKSFTSTGNREIDAGETVLIHFTAGVDGYSVDLGRAYIPGQPDEQVKTWLGAVLEARAAALDAIRPGAKGADVDRAAREVLAARGFNEMFKHPTGHGVGFANLGQNYAPFLHPQSGDILETGHVVNLEPAVYQEGVGGVRHCDIVGVTDSGPEVLTPFHTEATELILPV